MATHYKRHPGSVLQYFEESCHRVWCVWLLMRAYVRLFLIYNKVTQTVPVSRNFFLRQVSTTALVSKAVAVYSKPQMPEGNPLSRSVTIMCHLCHKVITWQLLFSILSCSSFSCVCALPISGWNVTMQWCNGSPQNGEYSFWDCLVKSDVKAISKILFYSLVTLWHCRLL